MLLSFVSETLKGQGQTKSQPMNWGHIAEMLGEEYLRLKEHVPTFASMCEGNESPADALQRLEESTTERIDHAVRVFAQDRQWPKLTPAEGLMLSFRVDFAGNLADLLAQQPQPWSDTDDPHLFEERIGWLMLFAWSEVGFAQVINPLRHLMDPMRH